MNPGMVSDEYVKETMWRRFHIDVKRTGKEWHGPCVKCGGIDRMIVFPNGHIWCRKGSCNFSAWLDDDKKDFKLDPLLVQQQKEETERRRKEKEARDQAWRNGYRAGYWEGWHAAMSTQNREWWYNRGITDEQIDFYGLGYTQEKKVYGKDDKEFVFPAYTIPKRDPEKWEVRQFDFRLVGAPKELGKYRQEYGVSPYPFFASAVTDGAAIVHEGAIKAMVTHEKLEHMVQVIGMPSCSPDEELIELLLPYNPLWIILDPGCLSEAHRMKRIAKHARIVELFEKPDDLWLSGMTTGQFREWCRQAR